MKTLQYILICTALLVLSSREIAHAAAEHPADNTGVNERDRRDTAVTADQQSWKEADVEVTRHIRKGIMAHENLSVYAQNIKIISTDDQIVLKGPVRSEAEIKVITKIAKGAAGTRVVKNELQIASND